MPRFSFKNIIPIGKEDLEKKKVELNEKLQSNNNALKKNVKVLESGVEEAKEKFNTMTESVDKVKKERKALNIKLKDLIDKYSQLESKVIGKKTKFDELSQISVELIKDVADKEKRLKTLNKAIEQANEIKPDIVKLKEELKSVGGELSLKKAGLSDMVVQEEIIKERLDGVQKAYDERIKPFEKELEKIKANQESLRKEYKKEIDKLEGDVAEIVEQFSKKKNELKGYEGQIKAAKSLLIDEFDKIKIATDELKQLERERAIVVREIADRKKRYEGWTIKEMDKVAKKVIKNKLEDIDKAGLRDIASAI
jgi:chromosome segregation ATPase